MKTRLVARTVTTRHHRAAAIAAVAVVALLAACTGPPADPTVPANVRSTLGDGEITVEWNPPATGLVTGYDVLVLDSAGNSTIFPTTETSLSLTDVTVHERYRIRVRVAAAPPRPPGAWSDLVWATYVEPVLPVVRIETAQRAPILDRENYVPATLQIDPNGSEFAAYSGTMGIRGRGNSTWSMAKKPYRMKLDTKSPIMGIASEKDWVLLANAADRSQLRTVTAVAASNATDLAYTPTLRHVEVILNGQYAGVYTLTQHNEIGSDRVDIEEMGPDDNSGVELTGGYRLEIDFRLEDNNEPGFRTNKWVPIVVKDPDPMTPAQRDYIRNYVQAFESSISATNWLDPTEGYRKYLDVDSFIDFYLVQELTRNQDVFASSTYFTKERGEDRFKFGPIWDFDISMGTTRGLSNQSPDGWWARTRGVWAPRLFLDPGLRQAVADRWDELLPEFSQISDQLEALGAELAPAIENDAAAWNYTQHETDEATWLADWLDARIAWLDAELDAP